jgi:anti-sigma28 factor (negative regulator of flagellin synthesis)
MHAFRKTSAQPRTVESSGKETQSSEQSASAASGTHFRAVRPTEAEAAAVARGQSLIDCAKVESLRFEIELGIWRGDSERIAKSVIDDGEFAPDALADDE